MKDQKQIIILIVLMVLSNFVSLTGQELEINEKEHFERQGLNVIVLDDVYPEGHQGGITIIQHGRRVAANGNLYLQPATGQWEPHPRLLDKKVILEENKIIATLMYPDSNRIKTADQPIIYPDFEFTYTVSVIADGPNFRIVVDLENPLPEEWVGKVGFNIELYPGNLFGKTYSIDNKSGIFPRYANSPVEPDGDGEYEAVPVAEGKEFIVAPEDEYYKIKFTNKKGNLQFIDGRVKHNNGWFVVRSLVPEGVTKNAIEWIIEVNTVKEWLYKPVIHVSQVGYHSNQRKKAIIELDKDDNPLSQIEIKKILSEGGYSTVLNVEPGKSEDFLRYNYLAADFSTIEEDGMYIVQYGESTSDPFKISRDVYKKGVWQPTLEYFLPVQMCHMKIFEKYRVWHDACHLDDALMAPENINHFDVYTHGKVPKQFTPLEHVTDLNKGGWHDAGDYDFRIESQMETILTLSYAYEEFDLQHDQTLVSQAEMLVEIHHPDGKPDILQQIEHGLLTVLGGYRQFGKLYRGILCPTLRQYAMLGDARSMTDNIIFEGEIKGIYEGFWYDHITTQYDKYYSPQKNRETKKEFIKDLDDRLVFLEDNPARQISGISGLAAASRVMKGYDDELSVEVINAAEDLWQKYRKTEIGWQEYRKVHALVELILTTRKEEYKDELIAMQSLVLDNINSIGWTLGRVIKHIDDEEFVSSVNQEILKVKEKVEKAAAENPFGIPYHPNIWGAGWGIQSFGFRHYFLYTGWPEVFTKDPMLNALNFILGCHPGENTSSFVSGVGAKSQIIAYGCNRGDWSFIPGGVISGTNLVRPDLPELLDWPFLWQQAEYVIGGGASHFMFLVLGADKILNEK